MSSMLRVDDLRVRQTESKVHELDEEQQQERRNKLLYSSYMRNRVDS